MDSLSVYLNMSTDTYVPCLLQTFFIVDEKVKVGWWLWPVWNILHMHQLYHFEVDWMTYAAAMLLTSLPGTYLNLEKQVKNSSRLVTFELVWDIPKMHKLYHFKVDQMNYTAGILLRKPSSDQYEPWKVGQK